VYPQRGLRGARRGDDRIDGGVAACAVDAQQERPRARHDGDVAYAAAQPDGGGALHLAAAEGRHARHQHVVLPRQGEACLHQQLPAVGGDHLARLAAQQHAADRQPRRLPTRGPGGLGQGDQEVVGHRDELLRPGGERRHAVGRDRLNLRRPGHAAFVPGRPALAEGDLLQQNRVIAAALELGQQAGAEGYGVGRPLTGQVVADGQVAVEGVQGQAALACAAQEQGPGAARRVGQ
jgi:hypothetical protein